MHLSKIQKLSLLIIILAGMLDTSLGANPNSSLLKRSPFLPPQTLSKPAQAMPLKDKIPFPELQFVGFSGSAPDWSFALFFKTLNQVKWLRIGAEFSGVKVVKFNASIPSLIVEHAGQRKNFKIAQSAPPPSPQPPRQVRMPNHNQASAITLPGQSALTLPGQSAITLPGLSELGAENKTIPRRRIIPPKKNNP